MTTATISTPVLPALRGSEKQIAWAEDIRRQFLDELTAAADRLGRAPARHRLMFAQELAAREAAAAGQPAPELPSLEPQFAPDELRDAIDQIMGEVSAATWIDCRGRGVDHTLTMTIGSIRAAARRAQA